METKRYVSYVIGELRRIDAVSGTSTGEIRAACLHFWEWPPENGPLIELDDGERSKAGEVRNLTMAGSLLRYAPEFFGKSRVEREGRVGDLPGRMKIGKNRGGVFRARRSVKGGF